MRYIDRFLLLNKLYIPPFISQFVSPNECPAPRRDRRHGGAPADQDPAHHEEHLSPAVHVHVLVGVGRAPVLHGVIPALPGAEHGLLPQDDEDGPGEGEAQGPPAPVRPDYDGKGEEELGRDSMHFSDFQLSCSYFGKGVYCNTGRPMSS